MNTILSATTVENGIHYTLVGDYYFPTCTLQEDMPAIGHWADLYERYLREKQPSEYTRLIWNCKLNDVLYSVQQDCEVRLSVLIRQIAEAEGVNEQLKSMDQLAWVRQMNNICSRAEESIRHELLGE